MDLWKTSTIRHCFVVGFNRVLDFLQIDSPILLIMDELCAENNEANYNVQKYLKFVGCLSKKFLNMYLQVMGRKKTV